MSTGVGVGMQRTPQHLTVSIKVPEENGNDLLLDFELQDWQQFVADTEGPASDAWDQLDAAPLCNRDVSICDGAPDGVPDSAYVPQAVGVDQHVQLSELEAKPYHAATNVAPADVLGAQTTSAFTPDLGSNGAPEQIEQSQGFQPSPPISCFGGAYTLDTLDTIIFGMPADSCNSQSPADTGVALEDWDLSLAASVSGPIDNLWDDPLDGVVVPEPWDLGSPLVMDMDPLKGTAETKVEFPAAFIPGPAFSQSPSPVRAADSSALCVPTVHTPQLVPNPMVPHSPASMVAPRMAEPLIMPQAPGRREARRKASLSAFMLEDFASDEEEDEYSLPAPKRSKTDKGARGPRRLPQSHSRVPPHEAVPEQDQCASASSEGEDKKRRKQHNPWNLEETEVLIAGVEKCGGGRWADIKKLGFAVIERRSAVDLKDKWRNLIRVACQSPQQAARTKCDKRREIPEELLARVRAVVDAAGGQQSRRSSTRGA